jgi:hypothetical protein
MLIFSVLIIADHIMIINATENQVLVCFVLIGEKQRLDDFHRLEYDSFYATFVVNHWTSCSGSIITNDGQSRWP